MKKINKIISKSLNQDWLKSVELTLNGFKFNEKKNMVQLEILVANDRYDYGEPGVQNKTEKFIFYPENIKQEQLSTLKLNKKVRINQITNISTFGQFNNMLSITGTVSFYD